MFSYLADITNHKDFTEEEGSKDRTIHSVSLNIGDVGQHSLFDCQRTLQTSSGVDKTPKIQHSTYEIEV
jgi:hypothetical protein